MERVDRVRGAERPPSPSASWAKLNTREKVWISILWIVTWGGGKGGGKQREVQGPAYMSGVSPEHLGHQGGVHVLLHKGEGNQFSS